ncbi:MAG: primase large subunit [Candidatus Methanomethylophilaceae archaeon]|nr:primase large subunit [Candidatus Methanomethylophilaceae archaeon]
MDTVRAARYPFLRDSAKLAEDNGADIESLVSSESYSQARSRGLERVLDALEDSEVSYRPLMNDFDRLMEVMSYPYARMIVSCINDRFLTKRYALAESVRMDRLLGSDDGLTVASVANELGVNASADGDGLRMHFGDYLRFSTRIKSPEWKLINTEVHHGYVVLAQEKFDRVLQNALQDKIEAELPLAVPESFVPHMRADIDRVSVILSETKSRYSPTGGGPIDLEHMPPCMKAILAQAHNGMNLPHSARFALVSFLHALGMDSAQILALFAQSPDFDESKSSYQIRHITGELSGTDGYTPPECSTMKTNGICFNEDNLCRSGHMNHPLTYYRVKSGTGRKQDAKSQ